MRGSRLLIAATLITKRPIFEKKRFLAREGVYSSFSHARRGLIAKIALSQCERGLFYASLPPYTKRGLIAKTALIMRGYQCIVATLHKKRSVA